MIRSFSKTIHFFIPYNFLNLYKLYLRPIYFYQTLITNISHFYFILLIKRDLC